MTVDELLCELDRRGLQVVCDGERVALRGRRVELTEILLDGARRHKATLLAAIKICPLCNTAISERLPTYWGADPVHRACGEAAFRTERASGNSVSRGTARLGLPGAAGTSKSLQ